MAPAGISSLLPAITSVFATLGSIETSYVPSLDMSENVVDPEPDGPLQRLAACEADMDRGAVA